MNCFQQIAINRLLQINCYKVSCYEQLINIVVDNILISIKDKKHNISYHIIQKILYLQSKQQEYNIMGGRITRAIYKNQRSSNKLNINSSNNQIRAITNSFSLVISSVASFLIGYLLRPHLFNINNKQIHQRQGNQWVTTLLSLLLIIGIQFGLVMRKTKHTTLLDPVKNYNKLLITVSTTSIIINLIAYLMSYRLDVMLKISYGLLWIGMGNICLLVINNAKFLSSKKQCKHSHTPHQEQQQGQMKSVKRTVYIYIIGALLHLGVYCSQYMKDVRVEKTAKDIFSKLSKQNNIQESLMNQSVKNIEKLPVQYQEIVLDSQNDEKLMLRIMFSFLIFMIITTIIAFQKKSLLHYFLYDRNKSQQRNLYQNKLLPLHRELSYTQSESQLKKTQSKSQYKTQYKSQYKTQSESQIISRNLTVKNTLIASIVYVIGCILIQSQRNYILEKCQMQKGLSLSFYDYLLQIFIVILTGYLILKVIILGIYHYLPKEVNRTQQKSLLIKKRMTIVAFTLLFIIFNLIIVTLNHTLTNQTQPINIIQKVMIPLGVSDILFVLITFFFIRFTKDQLLRFPQTSHQFYLNISLTVIFIVKYLIPYTTLKSITQIIIEYSARPFIRTIHLFKTSLFGESYQPMHSQNQDLFCLSLLIFIAILTLIFLNDQMSFIYLLTNRPVNLPKQSPTNEPLIPIRRQGNIIKNERNLQSSPSKNVSKQKIIPINSVLENPHQFYDESSTFLNTE